MRRFLIMLLLAIPMAAQQRAATPAAEEPDVVVDIPNVSVESIVLDVRDLRAHVSLDARVGNLVTLNAGADASIDKVRLEINGVQAEVYLVVRLDKVRDIIDRTLDTVDKNPQLVTRLLESVDRTVGTVGDVADTALQPGGVVSQTVGTVGRTLENVTAPGGVLTQTVNSLGQTVVRTIDQTGNIVERTVDQTGKLVGDKTLGKLLDLPVLNQTTDAAGQVVKQVRDTSGAVIEVVTDAGGKIVSSRVVKP
jgi:hypothetical protein